MGFIGDIVSGIIGSHAAGKAANAQETAAQQAQALSEQNQDNSINAQGQATRQQVANESPYMGVGQSAIQQLGQMASKGYGQTFQAPTAAQAEATPGYQFTLQQGENALQNSAASKGGLLSGNEAAAQQQYGQGLASTTYQQTYNNALNAYQQNYGQYENQLQSLQGLANTGQQATGQVNALEQAGAQNQGALNFAYSGQQGNDITNYGNAKASGYIGKANAWNNSINNANNQFMQMYALSQI